MSLSSWSQLFTVCCPLKIHLLTLRQEIKTETGDQGVWRWPMSCYDCKRKSLSGDLRCQWGIQWTTCNSLFESSDAWTPSLWDLQSQLPQDAQHLPFNFLNFLPAPFYSLSWKCIHFLTLRFCCHAPPSIQYFLPGGNSLVSIRECLLKPIIHQYQYYCNDD